MSASRPFDLGKLDFEGRRLKRRRQLLAFSAIPCVVAIVLAFKLLSIPLLSSWAHKSYKMVSFNNAVNTLAPLRLFNWFEPYKVSFNQGNAYFKKSDFKRAEDRFRSALSVVPFEKECDVRINLALSIERQADILVKNKEYDEAILQYDEVKAVLYSGQDSCGVQFNERSSSSESDKQDDSKDQQAEDTKKDSDSNESSQSGEANEKTAKKIERRVQEKSNSAKQARNGEQSDDSAQTDEGTPEELKATEEKMQQLEKQASDAQRERVKRQQSTRQSAEYDKLDRSYDDKNW